MLYIGSRIQEYRKKAELSQEEFADKIGVSRQAVSKWERDKAYPDLDRLVCICEILDVQMDELIYGEERKKQGELTQENLASNNIVHMKNLRGRNRQSEKNINWNLHFTNISYPDTSTKFPKKFLLICPKVCITMLFITNIEAISAKLLISILNH